MRLLMGGTDMVGEVKGVAVGRSRGDTRGKYEVDSKRRSLRHDLSELVLETVEECRAFGEDIVWIGLR